MGREEECPNPSDERANPLPNPAKLPFSDLSALNPIPEEAQASPTGREEECLNPSDEPLATEDPVMGTLTAGLTSLELQPQMWQSDPNGNADPPGRSLDSSSEGHIAEANAPPWTHGNQWFSRGELRLTPRGAD